MASIRKEVLIEARSEDAREALRDWGAPHERLVPGFVVDTRLDDDARRLVWSIADGSYTHHNGAAQILDAGDGRLRFVWVADLLPDDRAATTSEHMERGTRAVRETLEAHAADV